LKYLRGYTIFNFKLCEMIMCRVWILWRSKLSHYLKRVQ